MKSVVPDDVVCSDAAFERGHQPSRSPWRHRCGRGGGQWQRSRRLAPQAARRPRWCAPLASRHTSVQSSYGVAWHENCIGLFDELTISVGWRSVGWQATSHRPQQRRGRASATPSASSPTRTDKQASTQARPPRVECRVAASRSMPKRIIISAAPVRRSQIRSISWIDNQSRSALLLVHWQGSTLTIVVISAWPIGWKR